jgi:hypothetical protein
MRINIVNYEQKYGINGILSKYAYKMADNLKDLGCDVKVSDFPDSSEINHHINYRSYIPSGQIDTLMVTHIFPGDKYDKLKESMKTARLGICYSRETEEQVKHLGNMATVLPAHDGHQRRDKIVYIPTNVYPDKCKREAIFDEIRATGFHFVIMGTGWEPMIEKTKLKVTYLGAFNYEAHVKILNGADYCLYFGMDEGSMGILDATQAGVKTIAPLQGFHHEIGIDYPFNTSKELNDIFKKLGHNPVAHLTWERYAKEHLKLWQSLK